MRDAAKKSNSSNRVQVAVCIATFKRPELLRILLESLCKLSFAKVRAPSVQIVIVDNDVAQSAKPVCEAASCPWPVQYVCEPERGIVFARNRAIERARGAHFLAFIDDDVAPAPSWLDELLWTQEQFQADVVSGAILPTFAENVPSWIREGQFFRRPVFETGTPVEVCCTANVMVRANVLTVVPGFDRDFNFTGGEDTHFFTRVRESGFRMVFSKEAIVHEFISTERANFTWLLRRGFQAGNSWALCERHVHPGSRVTALRVLKELVHISRGVLQFLASPFTGKAQALRSLQIMSSGVGTLAGVAGHRFFPYRVAGSAAGASKPRLSRRLTDHQA